jgi:FeS assembly protein IscX
MFFAKTRANQLDTETNNEYKWHAIGWCGGLRTTGFARSARMQREFARPEFTWDDADKIGQALSEKHPELDPSDMSLSEVHRLAGQLKEFKGNPEDFIEPKLVAIRSAWNNEFLERTQ